MAQLIINIPNDKVAWLSDGFASRFDYQNQIVNPDYNDQIPADPVTNPQIIDNPENQIAFAKRMVIHMIKHEALAGHNRISKAADAADAEGVVFD